MPLAGNDYYRIGQGLLNEGNGAEALHYLREAEKELGASYDLRLALGRALAMIGEGEPAERYLRDCIDASPDRPEAYQALAELSKKQGHKEESRKLAAAARARGARADLPPPPESWAPESSAAKPGDLAFFCPACETPIHHGMEELACPHCHVNLIPLLHGHIRIESNLEGEQEFRCARCHLLLTGTEMTCPHCSSNLLTGEAPQQSDPVERLPAPRRLKSRAGLVSAVVGFLLLTFAVGQWREPGRRREAGRVWHAAIARAHGMALAEPEPAPAPSDHHEPMDVSVGGDQDLLSHFWRYFGALLLGLLALTFGLLKMAFDR